MGDGLRRGASAEHLSAQRPRYRTGSRLPSVAGTTATEPAIRHLCEHRFLPPTIMLCARVSPSQNPFVRRRHFSENPMRKPLRNQRLQTQEIFAAPGDFACRKVASIGRVPQPNRKAQSATFPRSETTVPAVNLTGRKVGPPRPLCRGRASSDRTAARFRKQATETEPFYCEEMSAGSQTIPRRATNNRTASGDVFQRDSHD